MFEEKIVSLNLQFYTSIQTNNVEAQLNATSEFLMLLSMENLPPIDPLILSNLVKHLVEFLKSPNTLLQFEAASALANVGTGTSDQIKVVVDSGAVPHLVCLLDSPDFDVQEQTLNALGSIAGDSSQNRDYVLECAALQPVINIATNSKKPSVVRNATRTLSNLCKGKRPQPYWEVIKHALPTLTDLLFSYDAEVVIDACWGISYLSDGTISQQRAVLHARVTVRLMEMLGDSMTAVQAPALRAIGNIVTDNDIHTEIFIKAGVLPILLRFLTGPNNYMQKETCWVISKITAGTSTRIQAVIDSNLVPPLIQLLSTGEDEIKKEAIRAIAFAISHGRIKHDQIRYLIQQGCIKPLCDQLYSKDQCTIEACLGALENILQVGESDRNTRGDDVNKYARLITAAGGKGAIDDLKTTGNYDNHWKSRRMMNTYFAIRQPECKSPVVITVEGACSTPDTWPYKHSTNDEPKVII